MNRRDFLSTVTAASVACMTKTTSAADPLSTAPEIVLTLRDAHVGSPEIDMDLLNSYGDQPAMVQAFFAEARALFQADRQARFAENAALAAAADRRGIRVLGGPLVGDIGADRASVWVRTVRPAEVAVHVLGPDGAKRFGPACSSCASDLTAVVTLDDLRPSTRYEYRVVLDGKPLEFEQETAFKTFPEPNAPGRFQFAFGGDFHKVGIHNPHLMDQVLRRGNRAMVLTGDLAVDDRNNETGLHRSDYLLRDLSPAWRMLAAAVPVYAAWDDHDYFDNDLSGIPRGYKADDVRALRAIWKQNWNNPRVSPAQEGIYFRTRLGPADLIMLDTRSLRKTERNAKNAYLGDKQMEWLKRELLRCTGPFVVITSGTMWSDYVSNGKDSWGVFDTKGREELFSFIEAHHIPGVLLITSDRHGARGFRIPRPSGYCFHEFEIGTLGGMTGPGAMAPDASTQLFGRTKIKAFGEFAFDTDRPDPRVTFRLVDEAGQVLEAITLRQSELTP